MGLVWLARTTNFMPIQSFVMSREPSKKEANPEVIYRFTHTYVELVSKNLCFNLVPQYTLTRSLYMQKN